MSPTIGLTFSRLLMLLSAVALLSIGADQTSALDLGDLDDSPTVASEHEVDIPFDPLTIEAASQRVEIPDPINIAGFGTSVAMDGNYLVVGAPLWGDVLNNQLGAAYVYFYDGASWNFQTKLSYPGSTVGSKFGEAVSISGDTIAIGARYDQLDTSHTKGCIYVFTRTGTNWTLQQQIVATNSSSGAQLGTSVAIEGDTIISGAEGEVLPGQFFGSGSAYVFSRSGTVWTQEAKLTDVDGNLPDQFGYGHSVAINQDTALVGVWFGVTSTNFTPGFAVAYRRTNGVWVREARLLGHDAANGDQAGYDVALRGNLAIVGAYRKAPGGAAYIFARNDATWTEQQELSTPPGNGGGLFGGSVAISGNRLLIGELNSDVHGNNHQGAAYEFVLDGSNWVYQTKLVASDGRISDFLGTDVAIQGNKFLCGAPGVDIGNFNNAGAVYYFIESPGTPDLEASSDSGTSNVDNITGNRNLAFDVAGITVGATVQLLRDGTVVDSKLADQASATLNDFAPADGTFKYTTRQIVSGETSSQSDYLSVTVDNTGPSVTINQSYPQDDPTNVQPVKFDIVFNEPVVGFDASHISLAGSTAGVGAANIAVSTLPYGLLVSVSNLSSDGAVLASLSAGAAVDLAGNVSLAATSTDNSITFDTTRPTVTVNQAVGQADPTSQLPINYTVIFSEPVQNFSGGNVTFRVGGADRFGTPVAVSGGPTVYNLAVSGFVSDSQIATVLIGANSVNDLAGNGNVASTSTDNGITVDNVGPSVTVDLAGGQLDPSSTLPVNYKVQFSEPVTGFDATHLSFSGSTVNTSHASAVITGSGSVYNVAISNVSREGTLKLSITAGAAHDSFGNLSKASTSTRNSVTLTYLIDGGFEFTNNIGLNPYWSSTSTAFGTSLCTVSACGNGGGTASPRSGNGWIWFDGANVTTGEQASASQSVTFPSGGTVTLGYFLRMGLVNAPASTTLQVQIDGNVLQTVNEASTSESTFAKRTIDVSAFADGGTHSVTFAYNRPSGGTFDNFSIDDVSLNVTLPTTSRAVFDFDGDGKTDVGITRLNGGIKEWWLSRSSNSNVFSTVFGVDSDISAPGDFTGDGKTDIAVFRPSTGQWFVLRSEDFSFFAFPFGANGDIPVPADYDGDGKTDPAVFRPSSNTWFISRTSDGQTTIAQFGAVGDKPVPADYDGDGKADIAVYRANNGAQEWWIQRSTAGLFATVFGVAGDKAVAGDYTGDGKTDIAVWRPSNGNWFVLRSEDLSFFAFPWGANGDIPAPGDYDGDGKFDATVFRQSSATWFINRTGGAGPLITSFGAATDNPVAGTFVR